MNAAALSIERLTALAQAGIGAREFLAEGVGVREIGYRSLVRGQCFYAAGPAAPDPGDFPMQTGMVREGEPALLCLAPGEWLSVSVKNDADTARAHLEAGMGQAGGVTHEVTDGRVVLRLSGIAAPWLLAKLSGLDFLRGSRGAAHCARTRLVDMAAIVYFHEADDEGPVFDLIADRSYAAYLWALLQAAAPHAAELTSTHGAFA